MAVFPAHIRLVVSGHTQGELWQNVLHYNLTGDDTTSIADIAQAWYVDIQSAFRAYANGQTRIDQIDVYDNDAPDGMYGSFTPDPASNTGTHAGTGGSPFDSYAAKLNVGTRITKPGSMRIPGVVTDNIITGGFIDGPMTSLVNAYLNDIEDGFSYGTVGAASLTVYGAPHAASTRFPARLEGVYNDVVSVTLVPYITTQNSRKYGRGA